MRYNAGMESHVTIEGRAQAEIVERKSRFICSMAHVEDEPAALAFIAEVRAANRMARHNPYAYVLRDARGASSDDGASRVAAVERVRCSDDGEPAKTAGMPVLSVVRGAGIVDVCVVVTRYFGGILLGTGGLARAYAQAAQAALAAARPSVVSPVVDISWRLPYALHDRARRLAQDEGALVVDAAFGEEVELTLRMIAGTEVRMLAVAAELEGGEPSIAIGAVHETVFPPERR